LFDRLLGALSELQFLTAFILFLDLLAPTVRSFLELTDLSDQPQRNLWRQLGTLRGLSTADQLQERASWDRWIHVGPLPPRAFVPAAQRHPELIADLASKRPALGGRVQ
jgi:hypothetical protein